MAEVIEHGDPDELAEVARFLAAEQGQEDDDPGAQLGLISDAELGPRAESPSPPPPPVADPRAQELWDEVLEDVANEINTPSLRVWFEATVPVALADETLTLAVPNAFAQEYIESRFKETIERSLKERLSENASLSTGVAATAATR